jgi:DNA-binding transcriptional LysR family regulator
LDYQPKEHSIESPLRSCSSGFPRLALRSLMELRHLRYFVAVAEELNFTRAAEKLRLAQPSLTRQIRNLEEELGVQLLDRTKNQVVLTEEGKSFLVDAKRLVTLSLESVKAVQRFSRGESGQLNLGYLFKFNFDLLPATLTTFYQECPDIAVNLFDMPPAEQIRALEARKIDLGFVGLRPPTTNKNIASLVWECVAHHSVVVVLPARHPLAKKSKLKRTDLRKLFFVTMSEETHPGSRDWLSGLCQQVGFTPRILQDVALESGIMTFVAEGLGVTLAREQIEKLPHPGVVFRPLAVPVKADYWIAWHKDNRSKALTQYIEIVKKEAPAWH